MTAGSTRRTPRSGSATKGHLLPEPFGKPKRGAAAQNNTRIVATYDFTRLRRLLSPDAKDDDAKLTREERSRVADSGGRSRRAVRSTGSRGAAPGPARARNVRAPRHEHGTHVAGILTADWKVTDEDMPNDQNLIGIASGLEVYDLRVLDENGHGDEFSLIAALQFVRYLNANKDQVLVHGVNASLSIRHDVANYACGQDARLRGVRATRGRRDRRRGRGGQRRLRALPDDRRRLERGVSAASASPTRATPRA